MINFICLSFTCNLSASIVHLFHFRLHYIGFFPPCTMFISAKFHTLNISLFVDFSFFIILLSISLFHFFSLLQFSILRKIVICRNLQLTISLILSFVFIISFESIHASGFFILYFFLTS